MYFQNCKKRSELAVFHISVPTCPLYNSAKKTAGNSRVKRSYPPTTVGSKSTKTALGTCLPAPVSLKNVLKESSPPPMVLSLGI